MGTSSTGILAYGYDLGDDFGFEYGQPRPAWYDSDDGWATSAENALLAAVGFTETDWRAEGFYDRQSEARKKLGVEFIRYGCDGYVCYILAATGTEKNAHDYGALDVDLSLARGVEQRVLWALEVLGLEPGGELGWVLASFYG